VNAKLEVGSVSETITVTGESPTVDTKSNLQQTVMTQAVLEGVPSGRDPWSLAKLIPGVQVATYDVGGTQSIQQSSLSSHGSSTNDVSYNIDGASVNWPGCVESDNYSSQIADGTFPKTFLGNPTKTTYDFNVAGGGALIKDKLWVNGSYRRWIVDKLVNSKNEDGSQAIDDNTLKNYSGKGVFSA